jgi:hypothetical protein
VTVLNRGHKRPAPTEGSRLCWALPSPVHERSGYRASRPTGYKVMRSFRIVAHGPVLASRLACHRDPARCGRAIIAPSSSRSRPLTRRLRRWPSASLDRASPRRQRSPPTNDALLTTYSPYKVQPINRPSLRNGVTAYGALSPGTGLSCPRHARDHHLARLTPASGCQDHTASPSVSASLVARHQHVHRIPRSTFVTTRTPLLMSAGRRDTITSF